MLDAPALTQAILAETRRLGFDLAGVTPAAAPTGLERFRAWLEAGYGGRMRYLADRAEARSHPRHVLEGVRSLVMLAIRYRTEEPATVGPGQGRVSRYAWGDDYHDLVHDRLRELIAFVRRHAPQARLRGVVDSAPLAEREFAQAAGLGWIGKHTLLLHRRLGSWFFLCALLTDLELEPTTTAETDHCGTCRACLDACPTAAFPEPYVLDASRCISYLTIELREAIPAELRAGLGSWALGCDVCQDVCPWNHKAPATDEPAFTPRAEHNPLALAELFALDEPAFRRRFRGTPLARPKRGGLLRNAAIVLGNQRDPAALDALGRGLADDAPLVRGACAWALGQLDTPEARARLRARAAVETDADVRAEIAAALGEPLDATSPAGPS